MKVGGDPSRPARSPRGTALGGKLGLQKKEELGWNADDSTGQAPIVPGAGMKGWKKLFAGAPSRVNTSEGTDTPSSCSRMMSAWPA